MHAQINQSMNVIIHSEQAKSTAEELRGEIEENGHSSTLLCLTAPTDLNEKIELDSVSGLYMMVDTSLFDLLFQRKHHRGFHSDVNDFMDNLEEKNKCISLFNRMEGDDNRFMKLFHHLPENCAKIVTEITFRVDDVKKKPSSSIDSGISDLSLTEDPKQDCGNKVNDNHRSRQRVMLDQELNRETEVVFPERFASMTSSPPEGSTASEGGEELDRQNSRAAEAELKSEEEGVLEQDESLSEESDNEHQPNVEVHAVQIGHNQTMELKWTAGQMVSASQEGWNNTTEINIVPQATNSKMILVFTTNPCDKNLERLLVKEFTDDTELINVSVKGFGASLLKVRSGSVVVEIEVKPGVTIDKEYTQNLMKIIFSGKAGKVIPEDTKLSVDIETKMVVPLEQLGKYVNLNPEKLHENCVSKEKYEEKVKEVNLLQRKLAQEVNTPPSEEMVASSMAQSVKEPSLESTRVEAPYYSDEEIQDDEDRETTRVSMDTDASELNLRDYQLELAENAVLGRNTIICAPTGSGRIRVSLHVIREHLDKQEQGKRKVLFLTREVSLVDQVYAILIQYLGHKYRVSNRSGEDEHSSYLHQYLEQYDILVMTPQILENQLKEEKIESVLVFSLIVLDECHHTRKGEPYNYLMLRYLKEKKKKGSQSLPQIVGLTASLGVEKARGVGEAIENILELCAILDAPYLSTVVKHVDELRALVPIPDEKTVPLMVNRQDEARKKLEKVMNKIENLMTEVNELNDGQMDNLLNECPAERDIEAYREWAEKVEEKALLLQTGTDPKRAEIAKSLFVMAKHLSRYSAVLETEKTMRIKDVINSLQKEFSHSCLETLLPWEEKLNEFFNDLKMDMMKLEHKHQSDQNYENPNLKVLGETLKALLEEKGEDFRGIIFVQTRATCYALTNWLNEDEKIDKQLKDLKATTLTGARQHKGGITWNEQEKVIDKFKSGQIKLIVATSVAEEGLDIPECNIVLKYSYLGNEITTVQTRGGISKEMLNVAWASKLQQAIKTIHDMPPEQVVGQIRDYQEELLDREAIKETVKRYHTNKKLKIDFSLICACCRKFCTKGSDMRIINGNQHVVIDQGFRDRIHVIPFKKKKKPFDEIQMTGSMQCKSCHKPWGVMFIYRGVSFPSLGIKYFIVTNERTHQPQYFKKWLELPYFIQEIASKDFKAYLGAAEASDDDEDDYDL